MSRLPLLVLALALSAVAQQYRLVTVDPGHFHAALVQKDMYPFLSPRVTVYAGLSPELLDYMNRISLFNQRAEQPTHWELDVRTGRDFFARMLREKAGNVAMFTGRNREKIARIQQSIDAGYSVFADKPWIIKASDMPKLEAVLDSAPRKGLAAYDIMTERFEITSLLQRELVQAEGVTGKVTAVEARSIHHLMKLIAGVPIKRPAWFFDIAEYGEGLADVGTHVVDLAHWTLFPEQMLDYRRDIRILSGKRWPTEIPLVQFQQVTGEAAFPAALAGAVKDGKLSYYCNNSVHYTIRGVDVKLDILWNWEAPAGSGDVYEAAFRGPLGSVELRQGAAEKFQPELYVKPWSPAVDRAIAAIEKRWPGVAVEKRNGEAHIAIPAKYRVGHEAHFAQVTNKFFEYVRDPKKLPAWEKAHMLAKYYVSTQGVEAAK